MNDPLMSPLLLGTAHELSSNSAFRPKYQFYIQASSYMKYPCNTWHIHGPKRIYNSDFECNNYKFRMKIMVTGAQISKILPPIPASTVETDDLWVEDFGGAGRNPVS